MKKDVTVVGGGISGLSCAFFLKKMGVNVMLCEKADRVGGVIRSVNEEGFLLEEGPNSLMGLTPNLQTMIESLSLGHDYLSPSLAAKRRYIYRRGELHLLPTHPLKMIGTSVLSLSSKLRILQEPFITRGRGEETVGQFFQKRIGPEATRILVDAFVGGIYAGDIDSLSASACFSHLVDLERKYGSITWGLFRTRKDRKKDRSVFSFEKGLEQLPLAIEKWLKKVISKKYQLLSLEKKNKEFYSLVFDTPEGEQTVETKSVVFATPSYVSAEALQRFDGKLATELLQIPYTSMCVFHLGFKREDIGDPLNGFGFLVPRSQQKRTLGVLWSSSLFNNRAPKDHVLLTVMVGGAMDATAYNDTLLLNQVLGEVSKILKIKKAPIFVREKRHMKAIPQYNVGHIEKRKKIQGVLAHSPGLFMTGSFLNGVSTVDCVDDGASLATHVQDYLKT